MTKEKFQEVFSGEFKAFLSTPCGQAFLQVVPMGMPVYEFAKEPHLFADNRGARRGYESCIRYMMLLSMQPQKTPDVEANYGVKDKADK